MSIIIKAVRTTIAVLSVVAPQKAISLTFKLFCKPAGRASVREAEQAMFDSAKKDQIEYKGEKVCTYSWGDLERPVLLIHGWESRGSRFAAIIKQLLEQGYSPVTFDMPGHGDSGGDRTTILQCNDICAQLQQKYGDFDSVIAHSFGVPCTFYAVKNTLNPQKIVAIAGLHDFDYLIDEFVRILGLNSKVKQGLITKVEEMFHPVEQVWDTFSVDHNKEKVTQQILVIHDDEDDVVQAAQAQKILNSYSSQASFHQTCGYGHKRILHQNDVVQRIAEFIN